MAVKAEDITDSVLRDGVVSVRQLAHHATQVLKLLEERGRPLMVTRHGRMVAVLAPITMSEAVDRILGDDQARSRLRWSEKAFAEGETQSAHRVLK